MKISDVIAHLESIKKEHGDITCCTSEEHEYWGSIESHLVYGYNLGIKEHAQPDGPKSGKSEKCVVFGV